MREEKERFAAEITLASARREPFRLEICGRPVDTFLADERKMCILPAGEVCLSVWERNNYAYPSYEERLFLQPSDAGTVVLGEEYAAFLPFENLPILAEKGHFRVLNMTRVPLCTKRKTGTVMIEKIAPQGVSDYKTAGMGGYTLRFDDKEERIQEVTFALSEAEMLLIIVTEWAVIIQKEREIQKRR